MLDPQLIWTVVGRNIKGRPFRVGLIVRLKACVNTKQALSRFATESLSCLAYFS